MKEGYFHRRVYFTATDRKEHRVGGYTNTDLAIVLEKKPAPAPLEVMKGQLMADAEGVIAVLKLVPGTRDAFNVRKAGGERLTEPYVVLEVGTTPDGQVERKQWRFDTGTLAEVPARAAVTFSTPDAGFAVYKPSSAPVLENLCFREMRQAPETGYSQRLDFADDVGDFVYFYCRIGSNFGKGHVSRPNFLEGKRMDSAVVAPITILLNPTGSRYVATDE